MPDPVNDQQLQDITLESLPDDVVASMESRDSWMATLPFEPGGFEFLVSDLQSWAPGQTVRVAFLGGSAELHEQIEKAKKRFVSPPARDAKSHESTDRPKEEGEESSNGEIQE